jgi:hypothetical protein
MTLGTLLSQKCQHLYEKRGFSQPLLALEWNTILPENLSRLSVPLRLSTKYDGSTELIVAVVPAKITEMSHFGNLIKDYIHKYFSLCLVDKVSFVADDSLSTLLKPPKPQTPHSTGIS